jgi:isoquinoline 1-oxidoreductase alpha subunit
LNANLIHNRKDFMENITLSVNGATYTVDVESDAPLLWVLRDQIGLKGTKFGCGAGLCGACTVHLDGRAVHSCRTKAVSAVGREITTIEGLSPDGSHPVQQAWLAESVSQCGYCQPGQIMNAAAFLAAHPKPTEAEIVAEQARVLCRCGTYQRILKAISRAAEAGGSS